MYVDLFVKGGQLDGSFDLSGNLPVCVFNVCFCLFILANKLLLLLLLIGHVVGACSKSQTPRSNTRDFTRLANTYSDSDGSRTDSGRLFQIRGLAMANDRYPNVVMFSTCNPADRFPGRRQPAQSNDIFYLLNPCCVLVPKYDNEHTGLLQL